MNKVKLHAHLIDIFAVGEDDTVIIQQSNDKRFTDIIIINDEISKFQYVGNKLTFCEGKVYVRDYEKMAMLDLEEFE